VIIDLGAPIKQVNEADAHASNLPAVERSVKVAEKDLRPVDQVM
jgi:hypothetical protein